MGRSRRWNRRGAPHHNAEVNVESTTVGQVSGETLAPTYVPVTPSPWSAASDTPVLPLEGLQPWDQIPGPSIAVEEELPLSSVMIPDSTDPTQLELTAKLPEAEPPAAPVQAELNLDREASLAPGVEDVEPSPPVAALEADVIAAPEPVVDPAELRFQEGRAAADDGRSAEARLIYREVIAQRPQHLSARNNLALLLETLGDQQGALGEYDRALELDGDHATLLTNRGALLGTMGRYAAAERDLKRVLRSDASHVEALFNLGVVMTRKGLWGEAVAQLRRVVEIDPTRGIAYFYLGEALNKVDDLYGAMGAYQRAAELLPDHPRALYGLGIVFDRLGRPDDAARMYRRSRETGRR